MVASNTKGMLKRGELLKREATWTFTEAWNESLDKVELREVRERDYLWASQLGNSVVDIYLAMTGVAPSNPFDTRAKRKFDAGVFWEWVVGMAAKRAGIFIDSQGRVEYQLDGCVPVVGKYDILMGGARKEGMVRRMRDALEMVELPQRFIKATDAVAESFEGKSWLPLRVTEIKSTSNFMYDSQYKYGIPARNHALQVFHYLLGTGIEEGAVVYISKEDSRMTEIPIWRDDGTLLTEYTELVQKVTDYYSKKELPPKEPEIIFDYDKGKFTDNWNIKYSAYLTYLYGFENEGEYQDAFRGKIASWNRVLGRVLMGEKMTDKNLEYIEEIKGYFPNFDDIVRHFRADDVVVADGGYKVTDGKEGE